jgi:hypothetical protein
MWSVLQQHHRQGACPVVNAEARQQRSIEQIRGSQMITYVTRQDFHDQFIHSKRDNFSYEMREALFDYLEQIEIDSGRPITLDANIVKPLSQT